MLLRREDPEFWKWFTENYAYDFAETGLHEEFVLADGTFDTQSWEAWVESKQQEYELLHTRLSN